MKSRPWFLYLAMTEDKRLYCGITTDLQRREREHNGSPRGAKALRGRKVRIVVAWAYADRSEASRSEAALKKCPPLRKHFLARFPSLWCGPVGYRAPDQIYIPDYSQEGTCPTTPPAWAWSASAGPRAHAT